MFWKNISKLSIFKKIYKETNFKMGRCKIQIDLTEKKISAETEIDFFSELSFFLMEKNSSNHLSIDQRANPNLQTFDHMERKRVHLLDRHIETSIDVPKLALP